MRARIRMMRLALAVEGYRRRHGGFPETLNAEDRLRFAEIPILAGCLSILLGPANTSCAPRLSGKEAKGGFGIFAARFGLAFSGAQSGLCGSGRMNKVGFPLRFKRPWRQIFRRSEFGVFRFGWGSSPKYLE